MKFPFDHNLSNQPAGRRKIVLAFLYAFFTAGAYVVGRSAADALFLARVGPSWLPLMYLISACSLGLMSVAFGTIAIRVSLRRMVIITLAILAFTSIVLCQVVQHFDHALVLLGLVYLLAELRGCFNAIQYGILVNELFAGSPGFHRANGLLGAAATLAGIVLGAFVGFEVHQLGTVYLLYIVAGLEVLGIIAIALLPRTETGMSAERRSQADTALATAQFDGYAPVSSTSGLRSAASSRYVRRIAAMVAITVIVGTLIEFQWKSSVAKSFTASEDQMARFFGLFHASVGLLTGAIQVLLTGLLLRRFGTRTLLMVFPAILFATTVGVLTASFGRFPLWPITLSKGCDVIKRSLNNPLVLMLYAPLSNGPRRHAITLVTGIVKPSAEAVAALLIILLAGVVSTLSFSYVVIALIVVWLVIASRHGTKDFIEDV